MRWCSPHNLGEDGFETEVNCEKRSLEVLLCTRHVCRSEKYVCDALLSHQSTFGSLNWHSGGWAWGRGNIYYENLPTMHIMGLCPLCFNGRTRPALYVDISIGFLLWSYNLTCEKSAARLAYPWAGFHHRVEFQQKMWKKWNVKKKKGFGVWQWKGFSGIMHEQVTNSIWRSASLWKDHTKWNVERCYAKLMDTNSADMSGTCPYMPPCNSILLLVSPKMNGWKSMLK